MLIHTTYSTKPLIGVVVLYIQNCEDKCSGSTSVSQQGITQIFWEDEVLTELGKMLAGHRLVIEQRLAHDEMIGVKIRS